MRASLSRLPLALSLLALLAAAGCGPRVPALLVLSNKPCDATPALNSAIAVPISPYGGAGARLGESSRCLQRAGERTPTTYAVFALGEPKDEGNYIISIISAAQGTVVAPRAAFLDGNGNTCAS